MEKKRVSKICYSMYCDKDTIPFHILFFLGLVGFLLGFIFDYILLIYFLQYGEFPLVCINGIHFHHMYFGIILFVVSGFLFLIIKSKQRIWISFFMGLGFGVALSDIVSHLLYDPFYFYC